MLLKEMLDKPIIYKFSSVILLLGLPVLILFLITPVLVIVYACFCYSSILGIVAVFPASIILYDFLSNYLWFCYCLFKGEPALSLSNESFVDNINRQIYKWEDIDQIGFRQNNGYGGYLWIKLNNAKLYKSKTVFRSIISKLNKKFFGGPFTIEPTLIEGKKKEILGRIMQYHSSRQVTGTPI